jgi:hypothetical protein
VADDVLLHRVRRTVEASLEQVDSMGYREVGGAPEYEHRDHAHEEHLARQLGTDRRFLRAEHHATS